MAKILISRLGVSRRKEPKFAERFLLWYLSTGFVGAISISSRFNFFFFYFSVIFSFIFFSKIRHKVIERPDRRFLYHFDHSKIKKKFFSLLFIIDRVKKILNKIILFILISFYNYFREHLHVKNVNKKLIHFLLIDMLMTHRRLQWQKWKWDKKKVMVFKNRTEKTLGAKQRLDQLETHAKYISHFSHR